MGDMRRFFRARSCSIFQEAAKVVEEKRNDLRKRTREIENKISNLPVELVEPEVIRWTKEASKLDWKVSKLLASLRHPASCFPFICCCSYYPGLKAQALLGRIDQVLNAEPEWREFTRHPPCTPEMAMAMLKEEMSRLEDLKKDLVSFVHEKFIISGKRQEIPTVLITWCQKVNRLLGEGVEGHSEEKVAGIRNEIKALVEEENRFWRDGVLVAIMAPQPAQDGKIEMDDVKIMLNDLKFLESVKMTLKMFLEKEIVASGRQRVMSIEVARWMREVNSLVEDVKGMEARSNECRPEKLTRIRARIVDFKNKGLTFLNPNKSHLVTVEPPEILVGFEENISKVFAYLKDDQVGIIEILGMRGAGKTTLVREIESRLMLPHPPIDFQLVIFVEMTRNPSISEIQWAILKCLGHTGRNIPEMLYERDSNIISRLLSKERFLLILDDVPEDFDLDTIGVPSLAENPKSKVLLTTRATRKDKDCENMDRPLKQLSIDLLSDDAWELFHCTNGTYEEYFESNEDIRKIADNIVSKCQGLPLVIKAVARALADKWNIQEWRDASLELNRYVPDLIPGMENVFRLLKYCLENLERKDFISCLLFFAFFPEDEEIDNHKVIDYWIAEGLLEFAYHSNLEKLQSLGHKIIKDLQNACLLEKGSGDYKVRMNGTIRDMAIWLGKGGKDGKYKHKFLQIESRHIEHAMVDSKWKNVERVWFRGIQKVVISSGISSAFLSLRTLLFKGEYLRSLQNIPEDLFIFTPNLFVLDLSENVELCSLPGSLWLLKSLRYLDLSGTGLKRIPEGIGSLISLQFLYLHWTKIEQVAVEVGQLVNLVVLDLSDMSDILFIPYRAISSLSKLQILDLSCTGLLSSDGGRIKDLNNLSALSSLSLSLNDHRDVKQIQECDVFNRSISHLGINSMENLTVADVIMVLSRLSIIKKLDIVDCKTLQGTLQLPGHNLQKLEKLQLINLPLLSCLVVESQWQLPNLRLLQIWCCHQLRDLGCLLQLPNLQNLAVFRCSSMVELIPSSEEAAKATSLSLAQTIDQISHLSFPKLESIDLRELPSLENISKAHLHLPLLEKMYVRNCPKLGKLAVIQSEKVVKIGCDKQWWEQLQWEGGNDTEGNKFRFQEYRH